MLVLFHSVKGAPGATTTMVALARRWPTLFDNAAVTVVDADPYGGDIANWYDVDIQNDLFAFVSLCNSIELSSLTASVQQITDTPFYLIPNRPGGLIGYTISKYWGIISHNILRLSATYRLLIDLGRVGLDTNTPDSIAANNKALYDIADLIVLVTPNNGIGFGHTLAAATALEQLGVSSHRIACVLVGNNPRGVHDIEFITKIRCIGVLPYAPKAIAQLLRHNALKVNRITKEYLAGIDRLAHNITSIVADAHTAALGVAAGPVPLDSTPNQSQLIGPQSDKSTSAFSLASDVSSWSPMSSHNSQVNPVAPAVQHDDSVNTNQLGPTEPVSTDFKPSVVSISLDDLTEVIPTGNSQVNTPISVNPNNGVTNPPNNSSPDIDHTDVNRASPQDSTSFHSNTYVSDSAEKVSLSSNDLADLMGFNPNLSTPTTDTFGLDNPSIPTSALNDAFGNANSDLWDSHAGGDIADTLAGASDNVPSNSPPDISLSPFADSSNTSVQHPSDPSVTRPSLSDLSTDELSPVELSTSDTWSDLDSAALLDSVNSSNSSPILGDSNDLSNIIPLTSRNGMSGDSGKYTSLVDSSSPASIASLFTRSDSTQLESHTVAFTVPDIDPSELNPADNLPTGASGSLFEDVFGGLANNSNDAFKGNGSIGSSSTPPSNMPQAPPSHVPNSVYFKRSEMFIPGSNSIQNNSTQNNTTDNSSDTKTSSTDNDASSNHSSDHSNDT